MDHKVGENESFNIFASRRKPNATLSNIGREKHTGKLSNNLTIFNNRHEKKIQKRKDEMDKEKDSIEKKNRKETKKRGREEDEEKNGNGKKKSEIRKVFRKAKIKKTKKSSETKGFERTHSDFKSFAFISLEGAVAKSADETKGKVVIEPYITGFASTKIDYSQSMFGTVDKLRKVSELSPKLNTDGEICDKARTVAKSKNRVDKPNIDCFRKHENGHPNSHSKDLSAFSFVFTPRLIYNNKINKKALLNLSFNIFKKVDGYNRQASVFEFINNNLQNDLLDTTQTKANQKCIKIIADQSHIPPLKSHNMKIKFEEFEKFSNKSFICLLHLLFAKVSTPVPRNTFAFSEKDLLQDRKNDGRLANEFAVRFYKWGSIAGIVFAFSLMNVTKFLYGFGKVQQQNLYSINVMS